VPKSLRLYLDQMLRVDVATALRNAGHNVVRAKLLMPFLRLHSSMQFENHLVILSSSRSKWVHTA
jgi:hypothetical protein